ncbi:hypothetical protein BD311DRAFT_749934, partial [Dichomitus squalens]
MSDTVGQDRVAIIQHRAAQGRTGIRPLPGWTSFVRTLAPGHPEFGRRFGRIGSGIGLLGGQFCPDQASFLWENNRGS